ncbi:glutathione S-transferase family protein [Bowmanella dokdonensis]|uniref:Glutathione S-transferase family protein n=1 Tax=Bowmanella dokdonensis TaxID=751969 RepID=A0A939DRB4_9ALTE|nr:glutathione S-transferase family protein [Bowmanella dokdonensis]MBN7827569.1 glutathione S-transferase family protein [Bowmanella dokdonensis]
MQIYWIKAQAPLRVLALCKHLGLQAEFIQLDPTNGSLKTDEFAKLNPNMKVPVLVDGDTVLWEASAIMVYLCNKAGSSLWPANNPAEQVEVIKWLSWNDCHWMEAVGTFYFEHIVKSTFSFGQLDIPAIEGSLPTFHHYAGILNQHLQDRTYAACNRLTIADFQLASMARYWREAKMPMGDYPNITSWLDRLMRLPAWAEPWPA